MMILRRDKQGASAVQRWLQALIQGRWFSGSNRRWWAAIIEAGFAAALLLIGVIWLVMNLTLSIIDRAPHDSTTYFVVYVLIAIALIGVGIGWLARLLWHVGVSAERRGAIAARASEIELLKELQQAREDLPTVPRDRRTPVPGRRLAFRMIPSPRNVWGLVLSAIFSIISVTLLTILVLVCLKAFGYGGAWVSRLEELGGRITPNELAQIPQRPWFAVLLLVAITPAAAWAVYGFFRQVLKLAGVGPTSIELSAYPLHPGQQCKLFISQAGRVRLKLFDVDLICQEEVTYNEGTDIRTEKSIVYEHRLLRRRGVSLITGKPFETELELAIPDSAMHSFKSTNNRIQWKIVITAKARNWPRLRRTFPITIHPAPKSAESGDPEPLEMST